MRRFRRASSSPSNGSRGAAAGRIALVRAVERARAEAATDPLTGIANRRIFESAFGHVGDESFAVAVVDLDEFKRVNDEHGHNIGDRACSCSPAHCNRCCDRTTSSPASAATSS